MNKFIFEPQPVSFLPVDGIDDLFPVNRIFCVGQNYAAHAAEMGCQDERAEPFFFQKHPSCIVRPGDNFPLPTISQEVHHEIEQVIALGTGGANIKTEDAISHIFGFAVGIDMTLRDIQTEAKTNGRPWDVAKGFDNSAPISAIRRIDKIPSFTDAIIKLTVNDQIKQDANTNQMIWKVPEIISYLSGIFTLSAGDLIMTGTPAGVGPIKKGDRLIGSLEHVGELSVHII